VRGEERRGDGEERSEEVREAESGRDSTWVVIRQRLENGLVAPSITEKGMSEGGRGEEDDERKREERRGEE
jgi:hypothetical protein